MLRLEDNETQEIIEVDADAIKADYLEEVAQVPRQVQDRLRPRSYRLCPAAHRDAVRQGADELPADAASPGLMRSLDRPWKCRCIHAGLAAGAALAALPVILHLFMRQTPKHVIFPALRLIRERQQQSKKRMRVKNWLLLLARMAILALMALALARPSLYSQVPLGDESRADGAWAWSSTPACP